MTHTVSIAGPAAIPAAEIAMLALEKALRPEEGAITAATETQLQNALHLLRQSPAGRGELARLESIALELRVLLEAKREGRPNFYASRLARLRRTVLH